MLHQSQDAAAALDMAGGAPAYLAHVFAFGFQRETGIKCNDSLDLGREQIERRSDRFNRLRGHIAKRFLHILEQGDEFPFSTFVSFNDRIEFRQVNLRWLHIGASVLLFEFSYFINLFNEVLNPDKPEITNYKRQITNKFQITISKSQIRSKTNCLEF
jgi:hypothetical protein